MELKMLHSSLLAAYKNQASEAHLKGYKNLNDSELTIATFSFYTSVAAVFSSKIEGENIDLDSYVKHKRFGVKFLPDYTQKIDDLYNAYQFAKTNKCNEQNILEAHKMLTKHILSENRQRKIRTGNMYVTSTDGKIEYVAASPFILNSELEKFFQDLQTLIDAKLSIQEVFFFASLLHLVFVKIIHLMMEMDELPGL